MDDVDLSPSRTDEERIFPRLARFSNKIFCACEVLVVYFTMFGVTTSDDNRPVTWIGRYPVRVTSIVCALLVVGMFVTVACETARWNFLMLAFEPHAFLHGYFWQPLTAPFVQEATFFFLFGVLFFYWAGNQVEQYLGVRRYLFLLGLLLLVPPVFLITWNFFGVAVYWFGSNELFIGMFIAFATIYPSLEVFGWISLKWMAFAGIVIGSLNYLPQHRWGPLSIMLGMCLLAFEYIRFVQTGGAGPELAWLQRVKNFNRRKPKLHVVQRSTSTRRVVEPEDVSASVDPILDKIAKSGIASLTSNERRTLDRARARLLKDDAD